MQLLHTEGQRAREGPRGRMMGPGVPRAVSTREVWQVEQKVMVPKDAAWNRKPLCICGFLRKWMKLRFKKRKGKDCHRESVSC